MIPHFTSTGYYDWHVTSDTSVNSELGFFFNLSFCLSWDQILSAMARRCAAGVINCDSLKNC